MCVALGLRLSDRLVLVVKLWWKSMASIHTSWSHAANLIPPAWQLEYDSLRVVVDLLHVCDLQLFAEEHILWHGQRVRERRLRRVHPQWLSVVEIISCCEDGDGGCGREDRPPADDGGHLYRFADRLYKVNVWPSVE